MRTAILDLAAHRSFAGISLQHANFWMHDELNHLQMQSCFEVFSLWGEGFNPSMAVDEGSTFVQIPSHPLDIGPKQHGLRPKTKITAFQKHSYHRACRRVVLHGCAGRMDVVYRCMTFLQHWLQL